MLIALDNELQYSVSCPPLQDSVIILLRDVLVNGVTLLYTVLYLLV